MAVLNAWQKIDWVIQGNPWGTGADGAYTPSTSTDAPIDSACTGTSASNSLSATNASFTDQVILIHQTRGTNAGLWEINRIQSYSSGTITTLRPLANTYTTGAQVLVIQQYTDVTIGGGVTLTAKAWNGSVGGVVVLLGKLSISGSGTITVQGKGFRGGTSRTSDLPADQGEGTAGAGATSVSANGNAGGGGDGYNSGDGRKGGAGGGHANSGSNGGTGAGTNGLAIGGSTAGSADLVTAVFGGSGGGAGGGGGETVSNGADSGGFVLLIGKDIGNGLTINCNGNSSGAAAHASGGAAAGGSALFVGQTVTLTTVTASAGSAGAAPTTGGAASVGRIAVHHSGTVTGTSTPTFTDVTDTSLFETLGGTGNYSFFM